VVFRSLWGAKLLVSEATARKLASKHGLDHRDIHEAIVCVSGLAYTWHRHPARGLRALVEVSVCGRPCVVILYPIADTLGDVYALGSAYPR
jgi:hypothetical protein